MPLKRFRDFIILSQKTLLLTDLPKVFLNYRIWTVKRITLRFWLAIHISTETMTYILSTGSLDRVLYGEMLGKNRIIDIYGLHSGNYSIQLRAHGTSEYISIPISILAPTTNNMGLQNHFVGNLFL